MFITIKVTLISLNLEKVKLFLIPKMDLSNSNDSKNNVISNNKDGKNTVISNNKNGKNYYLKIFDFLPSLLFPVTNVV